MISSNSIFIYCICFEFWFCPFRNQRKISKCTNTCFMEFSLNFKCEYCHVFKIRHFAKISANVQSTDYVCRVLTAEYDISHKSWRSFKRTMEFTGEYVVGVNSTIYLLQYIILLLPTCATDNHLPLLPLRKRVYCK